MKMLVTLNYCGLELADGSGSRFSEKVLMSFIAHYGLDGKDGKDGLDGQNGKDGQDADIEGCDRAIASANAAAARAAAAAVDVQSAAASADAAAANANAAAWSLDARLPQSGAQGTLLSKGAAGQPNMWVDPRITGAKTANGSFLSYDPRLFTNSDMSVAAMFTTGDDVQTQQYIVGHTLSGFGLVISLGTLWIGDLNGASIFAGVQPNTTYFVVYTSEDDKISMWVNNIWVAANVSRATPGTNNSFVIGAVDGQAYLHFLGTVHFVRMWTEYVLHELDINIIWNNGHPESAVMPQYMYAGSYGLMGEFLPSGLSAAGWRNSAVAGLDLPAAGAPEIDYLAPGSLTDVIIDTGNFYTDIAAGVTTKAIKLIMGYVPVWIEIMALGAAPNISGITVWTDLNSQRLLFNAGINDATLRKVVWLGGAVSDPNGSFSPKGNAMAANIYTGALTAETLYVNATGNTPAQGLRIKIGMKYTGTGLF